MAVGGGGMSSWHISMRIVHHLVLLGRDYDRTGADEVKQSPRLAFRCCDFGGRSRVG